ncbi:MAG TPA: DISARM system helicase DrmA [Chloroflexia bacterium]|nr:DISARM system helicase DrmA [Chloroflexia bacterium]
MEIIKLPARLTAADSTIDLPQINARLQKGLASLDWSKVLEAEDMLVEGLLQGLDLVRDDQVLGIDTVPEGLTRQVVNALRKASRKSTNGNDGAAGSSPEAIRQPTPAPAIWQAPEETNDQSAFQKNDLPKPGEAAVSAPDVPGAGKAELLKAASPYEIRAELEELVLKDLLGPAGGADEELREKVRDRYLVGLLAPGKLQDEPDPDEHLDLTEQEELSSAENGKSGEDGSNDAASQQLISFCPSSMGLSFSVASDARELKITARWGHYRRQYSETQFGQDGRPIMVWKRAQREGSTVILLKEGKLKDWRPSPIEQPEVVVRGIVRRSRNNPDWSVTLFLVNRQHEPEKNRDSAWLFQPELAVEDPGGVAIFRSRYVTGQSFITNPDQEEQRNMGMLYRKRVNFAVGHGVSVKADTHPEDTTRAYRLCSSVVPAHEVPRTDHLTPGSYPELEGLILEMQKLSRLDGQELEQALRPLTVAYAAWITRQRARLKNEPDLKQFEQSATKALDKCQEALKRIDAGITSLRDNKEAVQAFHFMNETMHRQFVQSRLAEARRQKQNLKPGEVEAPAWRPFQIAFILLSLPSLTDLHHTDRSAEEGALADLLWFPTGGGKTEAYLGLTAYTLAIRRIQGNVGGRAGEEGVAVIMRYTLRLLTLQQFQRAAALICACEVVRREALQKGDLTWGQTPFRLGLWVGQRATPNSNAESDDALKQEGGRGSVIGGSGTPRQISNCPWCGNSIKITVETFAKGHCRTFMYCQDSLGDCPFTEKRASGEGLPVLVVDEEIYRRLPALLIATVDKFAQMPWKGAIQNLFGQVQKKCERHGFVYPDPPSGSEEPAFHPARNGMPAAKVVEHPPLRPPDLIIQDELHLISGPLGTMVGLYETAVDHLCSWELDGKTVRPKVVAATATIRRAERQVHSLFLRDVNIFPPSGLDITDNFFSHQVRPDESTPGRRYVGICASGRRLKAALIRVYVAYLSAAQYLYERKYGAAVDPYMTLVGYFNSLSDLGGTRRLVEDDVRSRLQRMDERKLANRKYLNLEELTSRRSSVDIPRLLDKLERKFEPVKVKNAGDLNGSDGENWQDKPLDVLLATNMISVGVDVQRLGLMVVTGQPKNTAEYIQATSRVGRRHPGLVCVVYNWARPRDLSHYEQFEHYHATYYQYVEALSVTPFAARAIDRGLSALLVSYIRLSDPDSSENIKAADFSLALPDFNEAKAAISRRASQVKNKAASEMVKARLEELGELWVMETRVKGRKLGYKEEKGTVAGLLEQPGKGEWKAFTCLNSLRDVEPGVKLILDEGDIGPVESSYAGKEAEVPVAPEKPDAAIIN